MARMAGTAARAEALLGHGVVSTTDAAADQPDGRQTVVSSGVKGSGAGTGVTGIFDNVSVLVPNPF